MLPPRWWAFGNGSDRSQDEQLLPDIARALCDFKPSERAETADLTGTEREDSNLDRSCLL